MDFESFSWPAMAGLSFLLGARHGLDADHIASIDGISRLQHSAGNIRLAGLSGLLFATGHGAVVLALALAIAVLAGAADTPVVPAWLDGVGTLISVILLSIIGAVNLRNALSPDPSPLPVSPIARRLLRLNLLRGAGSGLAIGALFALSVDTIGMAAMFAAVGIQRGGITEVALLAALFALGMMLSDSINGWIVARMIGRSNGFPRRARRGFALLLATTALAVAGLGVARLMARPLDVILDANGGWLSAGIVLAVLGGWLLARRAAD